MDRLLIGGEAFEQGLVVAADGLAAALIEAAAVAEGDQFVDQQDAVAPGRMHRAQRIGTRHGILMHPSCGLFDREQACVGKYDHQQHDRDDNRKTRQDALAKRPIPHRRSPVLVKASRCYAVGSFPQLFCSGLTYITDATRGSILLLRTSEARRFIPTTRHFPLAAAPLAYPSRP
ncbi:hypothetical protein D9M70_548920 [compost metagenome]